MAGSKVQAGFTKLPNAVYGALTGDEIALYAYLTHRQGGNKTSFWTREKIALELAMSESKVKRVTKSLVLKGWLSVHRAPNPKGWAVNHYRVLTPIKGEVLTPNTGQKDELIGVTGDLLKITRKENNQQQQASAPKEPLSLNEPSILEKPFLDKPILEKQVSNETKGALEEGNERDPYPDLIELVKILPERIQRELKITYAVGDSMAQLMLTQNRSLAELKLTLGSPDFWEGKGPGYLTYWFRKQLEIGYTLKEGSPIVPNVWSADNRPPHCGECDPVTRKTVTSNAIPKGNGAVTHSCLNCDPFMVNKYGTRTLKLMERRY